MVLPNNYISKAKLQIYIVIISLFLLLKAANIYCGYYIQFLEMVAFLYTNLK